MVETVRIRINPSIGVDGILVTMYDSRLKLHNDVFTKLGEFFPQQRLQTVVRNNIALAEATSFGKSIFEYAPKSHGAEDYHNLGKEIIQRGTNNDVKKKNR
jgi:chromosome partitioning protein